MSGARRSRRSPRGRSQRRGALVCASDADLDEWAARNLVDYLVEQIDATGTLPERPQTIGDRTLPRRARRLAHLCDDALWVASPRALGPRDRGSALATSAGYQVQTLWSDDGIVLRFADAEDLPPLDVLLPDPEEVEDLVVVTARKLRAFCRAQFRENAARALLLPRRRPGKPHPALWTQRLRAQNLLAVAREFPSFPIMLETYRTCLQDVFDLRGLVEVLSAVRRRAIRVREVETRNASPFASSLVFAYTAVYLYQGDTPVAERRASALALDRTMLRDLLGSEELRDLLDATVIEETEAELQGLATEFRARHADALHDLLRRVGDLSRSEIEARCEEAPDLWIESLVATRRILCVVIAGESRFVAAEDAALFRDALGSALPQGIPDVFLEARDKPLQQLALRYARTHTPFVTQQIADRFGLVPVQIDGVLTGLEAEGKLQAGDFHPHGTLREWCEPEVLRRLRRRTLAKLRGEVAPVEARTLARFLPRWHGIPAEGAGETRLREVLEQLEGIPLPVSELERAILPARVSDYDPRMLDELGARGLYVWIGHGALGERDGRIALYRRDRVGALCEAPLVTDAEGGELTALHHAILDHLGEHGASFFSELQGAAPEVESGALLDALWDLVWRGYLTNDTFAPLRALGRRRAPRRRGDGSSSGAVAGRWSLVASLIREELSATKRAHTTALTLLERYGIVSRDVMALEAIRGGMSAVYPLFREMEEAGKVRRGHFVDALAGAQFAFAGAVDRLRAERNAEAGEPILLAAVDPANPFGFLLPWPELLSDSAKARRAVGASLILVDGLPVFFVDRSGSRVLHFALPEAEDAVALRTRAAGHLASRFFDRRRRGVRIETIDGASAEQSPHREAFFAAGFRAEYKSLVFDRYAEGSGVEGRPRVSSDPTPTRH